MARPAVVLLLACLLMGVQLIQASRAGSRLGIRITQSSSGQSAGGTTLDPASQAEKQEEGGEEEEYPEPDAEGNLKDVAEADEPSNSNTGNSHEKGNAAAENNAKQNEDDGDDDGDYPEPDPEGMQDEIALVLAMNKVNSEQELQDRAKKQDRDADPEAETITPIQLQPDEEIQMAREENSGHAAQALLEVDSESPRLQTFECARCSSPNGKCAQGSSLCLCRHGYIGARCQYRSLCFNRTITPQFEQCLKRLDNFTCELAHPELLQEKRCASGFSCEHSTGDCVPS